MSDYQVKTTIRELKEFAEDIQEYFPKLTEFECAKIAVQYQQNRLLQAAFMVSPGDKYLGALEAIAIQLGQKPID